jgi:uncharacterized protein (TIGR03086 family)
MKPDFADLYGRAGDWAATKVAGAASILGAATTCDEWDVRTLINHMLDTQNYFAGVARGDSARPPSSAPPDLVGQDPVAAFERARADVLTAFGAPGVLEKTGPSLGIAFSDMLLHGWDVAKSTGQDTAMPDGLADAAFKMIHGRFTDEQRKGVFKPEIAVAADAPAQTKLLAYTGRDPST